tara:strand:- start:782 stop:1309 length:528 start_codon:yes stop_codon:yes gene_type:complete
MSKKNIVKYLPITLFFSLVFMSLIQFILLNFFPTPLPNIFMFIIYASIIVLPYSFFISRKASLDSCSKNNKSRSTWHSIKATLVVIITYIVIYFFNMFREPFNELITNQNISNFIADYFYISLNLALITIINAHDSIKRSCVLIPTEIESNMVELDKFLNKKQKKKKRREIQITD